MPSRHAHVMPMVSPHAPTTDSVTPYPCPHAAHTRAPAPWTPTDASPLSEGAQRLMPPHIPRRCPRAALTRTACPPYMPPGPPYVPPGPPYVPPTARRPTCRPPSLSATRPPSHVHPFDLGVLTTAAKLSDVDNKLTVAAFCRRRLAVVVCMARLAETVSAVRARRSSLCSPSSRPMGDVSHRPRQRGPERVRTAQGHGHRPRVGCGGSVRTHGIVGRNCEGRNA